MIQRVALAAVALATAACTGTPSPPPTSGTSAPTVPTSGRADVGGYELAYECHGEGSPTVILEAGLGGAGTDQFFSFMDRIGDDARVCTYDRAGTGASDLRPADTGTVTAGLMARELHALLGAIAVEPPVILIGFSYGGMPVRAYEGEYPDEVAGMVLLDASSEPEVPIYERLHAGPWIDDTDRIDIHATVRELHAAGDLGDLPLIVVTAGQIEDRWLATVPRLAAKAQVRLAGLSSDADQVVAPDSGHFVFEDDPDVVVTAIRSVLDAARSDAALPDCVTAFEETDALCVKPGDVPKLEPAA